MSESEDIPWRIYRQTPNFSLLEAAFLWLEIVPTKEKLESPPHFVEAQKKILNDKIFDYYRKRMGECLQLHAKPGLSNTEIINEYMRSDKGPFYLNVKMGLVEHHDDQETEQIGRFSYTLEDRFYERFKPKEYEAVSSDTLKEIAEILNEKPKFLFPDEIKEVDSEQQKDVAQSSNKTPKSLSPENNVDGLNSQRVHKKTYQKLVKDLQNDVMDKKTRSLLPDSSLPKENEDGWQQGDGSKNSLQNQVRSLLKRLSIDPKNRNAVGKINSPNISDRTILKILIEIEPNRNS